MVQGPLKQMSDIQIHKYTNTVWVKLLDRPIHVIYFWKCNCTRTSKTMFPGVWHANTEIQIHKYSPCQICSPFRVPCGKKVRRMEKSTLPLVVTIYDYEVFFWYIPMFLGTEVFCLKIRSGLCLTCSFFNVYILSQRWGCFESHRTHTVYIKYLNQQRKKFHMQNNPNVQHV